MVTDLPPRNVQFVPVWSKVGAAEQQEIVHFWLLHRAMVPREALSRAGQAAVLIRNNEGVLVGISTAERKAVRLLNNHYLFEVRCFIAPRARQPALDTMLLVETKRELGTHRHFNGRDTIGLLLAIESEAPKKWTKAYWPGSDYYFIGFTSQGHHVRVSYFSDAKI